VSAIRRSIEEIRRDRALTFYGAALALANVVTFVQWKFANGVPLMIGRGADSLCWPFWESCHRYQLPVTVVNGALWLYLLLSLGAAGCFLARRAAGGYWLLLLVNAMRTAIMFQDYRLRANQHYMLNFVVLVFLFLPFKRALLHHALASLYFWAGVLKLDRDWITGLSLYSQDRLWLPRALVPAACVYVVVMEMVLIWGIYSRRNWVFWGTLGQLAFFHYTSWPIVGFWYPCLMFCLLAILPLARILNPREEWIPRFWQPQPGRRVAFALVLLFGALQMVPRAFPGDTAITGEGRMFALHMFDAIVECDATFVYHSRDGSDRIEYRPEATKLPHRARCDPLIYYATARNECARISDGRPSSAADAGAIDFDVRLRSRRNSSGAYTQVLDVRDFCQADPQYAVWRHNAWIGIPGHLQALVAGVAAR